MYQHDKPVGRPAKSQTQELLSRGLHHIATLKGKQPLHASAKVQKVGRLYKGSQWSGDPCLAMQDHSHIWGHLQGLPLLGSLCMINPRLLTTLI